MDEAWGIKNQVQGGQDSLQIHTGQDGNLSAERKLLHEVIVQTITERRIDANPNIPRDIQLFDHMERIQDSPAYKDLAKQGDFSRESVSQLLDSAGLDKLPTVPQDKHITMMVTGGPATGKTALMDRLGQSNPQVFDNSAKINPDDYKAILADPAIYGTGYADIAHREGSALTNKIMGRLKDNIAEGNAPNIVLDVVSPNKVRMDLALQSSQLVVVQGTLDPAKAVERSYERGKPKVDPITGETTLGRQTPTEIVLEGAQKVAKTTPDFFDHPNVEMRIYDTDVEYGKPPKLVAQWDPDEKHMIVHNPDAFMNMVERQNMNIKAESPDQLYTAEATTPKQNADNLKAYTDKGISISFLGENGKPAISMTPTETIVTEPLPSSRGDGFFNELAAEKDHISRPSASNDDHFHKPEQSTAAGIDHKAGRAVGAAGVAVDLAAGDYGSAAAGAAMEAATSESLWKSAAKFGAAGAQIAKRIPLVGAAVTFGFVAYEVGGHALNGDGKKAMAAAAAGGAEIAGNAVGFGAGDAAREAVRGGIIAAGGEEYEDIEKSGLRQLGEKGIDIVSKFNQESAGTPAQISEMQTSMLAKSGLDSIEKDGNTVNVAEILRDPQQRTAFISSLEQSAASTTNPESKEYISDMVTASKAFVELEERKKAMLTAANDAPTVPNEQLVARTSSYAAPLGMP